MICKKCSIIFEAKKGLVNYCSLQCRNSHVRTDESKKKIAKIMLELNLPKRIVSEETKKKIFETKSKNNSLLIRVTEKMKNCSYCKKEFISTRGRSSHFPTLCSDECYLSMKKYNAKGIKRQYYNGLIFDSGWEVEIAKFLDSNNFEWIQPKQAVCWIDKKGKQRRYYPDFYLPKFAVFLDPKNLYCIEQQKEKLLAVSSLINLIYGHPSVIKDFLYKLPI